MFPSTRRTIQSNTGLGQLGGGGDGGSAYGEITLTSQTRIFRWMEENCDLMETLLISRNGLKKIIVICK